MCLLLEKGTEQDPRYPWYTSQSLDPIKWFKWCLVYAWSRHALSLRYYGVEATRQLSIGSVWVVNISSHRVTLTSYLYYSWINSLHQQPKVLTQLEIESFNWNVEHYYLTYEPCIRLMDPYKKRHSVQGRFDNSTIAVN